jgi:mRNA interferase RelE/StbE
MAWRVSVAKPAQKQIARFPAKDQERIGAAIRMLAHDPFSGDVLKLEGMGQRWRRRVGNYRIFFSVDSMEKAVYVLAVMRRTSTTY